MKTADSIEEMKAQSNSSDQAKKSKEQLVAERTERIKPWRYKPGQSGHPGGRPKNDIAREIAQAVFENNPEAVYKAMAKALTKGNAYVFKELAERGFGKLKETHEVQGLDVLAEALAKARKRAE